jgi:hypothetical protein
MHGNDKKYILGRQRCKLEDNIKMDLKEAGFGSVDCIHMAQISVQYVALVNMVMNLQIP